MHPLALPLSAIPFPAIDPDIFSIGPFSFDWPVEFTIGPLAVHWYGVMYVVGILLGWVYAKKIVSTPRLWPETGAPFNADDLDEFLTWAIAGIVLGGRVGYVLFYNLSHYLANPAEIIAVWDGGMSFHGGAIGTVIAIIVFARSRGFTPYSLLDVIAASSCFGIFFVRIANFINSELWGRTTDVAWGIVFPTGGPEPRHPSQLYEAMLEGALLALILGLLIFKFSKLKTPGFVGGAWLVGYGFSRIFVEFFRQPDAHIGFLGGGWLTMGITLSIPMVAIGVWAMVTAKNRVPWHDRPKDEEMA